MMIYSSLTNIFVSMKQSKSFYQSGQVGVIIILIMSVLLTVGLSLSANTNTDLIISQQEEESNRVFNAAEVGIEEALSSDLTFEAQSQSGTVETIGDVEVGYNIAKTNTLETRLFEGVSVKIDVSNAADGDTMGIDWGRESDCADNPASLLVSVYSDDAGSTKVRHYAYRSCDRSDGFENSTDINERELHHRVDVPMQAGDQFARIKPVYNDAHIRVYSSSAAWDFPVQGLVIRSEASSDLGNENRAVEVTRSLPSAPSVMDYALYSGTTIIK